MKNFNIKSIILGIGIGTIITSIISMIYLAGLTPKMSKEEIISKAKEYGMVEGLGLIQSKTNEIDKKDESTKKSTTNMPTTTTQVETTKLPSVQETTSGNIEVLISIKAGDSSGVVAKKLFDAGVIKDITAFSKALVDAGLSDNINIGEYKFKKDSDISNIIKTITK